MQLLFSLVLPFFYMTFDSSHTHHAAHMRCAIYYTQYVHLDIEIEIEALARDFIQHLSFLIKNSCSVFEFD